MGKSCKKNLKIKTTVIVTARWARYKKIKKLTTDTFLVRLYNNKMRKIYNNEIFTREVTEVFSSDFNELLICIIF